MHIQEKENGQGLVEYALILVLVAVVVIAILTILGPTVTLVYARVIGGFSGQSVTLQGNEVIILGLSEDWSNGGGGTCNLTVSADAMVGLVDGELVTDQSITARAYIDNVATSATYTADVGANGIAEIGGNSTTANGVDCGNLTFRLVP